MQNNLDGSLVLFWKLIKNKYSKYICVECLIKNEILGYTNAGRKVMVI